MCVCKSLHYYGWLRHSQHLEKNNFVGNTLGKLRLECKYILLTKLDSDHKAKTQWILSPWKCILWVSLTSPQSIYRTVDHYIAFKGSTVWESHELNTVLYTVVCVMVLEACISACICFMLACRACTQIHTQVWRQQAAGSLLISDRSSWDSVACCILNTVRGLRIRNHKS